MSPRVVERFSGARALLCVGIGIAALTLSACQVKTHAMATVSGSVCTRTECPWLNSRLPIARRVALLMRRMTLADDIKLIGKHGRGVKLCFGIAGKSGTTCLPPIDLRDGPNGVGDGARGVTQLPAGAALAATFSRRLAYEYGQVIGAEQASKGVSIDLGPTVNIDRDPRWGREFESLSEDPYLAGRVATAEIRGIQSKGTIAQVNHIFDVGAGGGSREAMHRITVGSDETIEIPLPAQYVREQVAILAAEVPVDSCV